MTTFWMILFFVVAFVLAWVLGGLYFNSRKQHQPGAGEPAPGPAATDASGTDLHTERNLP